MPRCATTSRFLHIPFFLLLALCGSAKAEPPYRYQNFEMFVDPADLRLVAKENCTPAWPPASLAHKETGTVELKLMRNSDGVVTRTKLVNTSGFRDLDMATLKGFIGCKFKAPQVDEKTGDSWVSLQYIWKIE